MVTLVDMCFLSDIPGHGGVSNAMVGMTVLKCTLDSLDLMFYIFQF